jgi:hypothetical protein
MLVLLVVCLQSDAPIAVVLMVAALAGACLPPVSACTRALWQHVSEDTSIVGAAYALDAVTQETIWIVGPLLVGVVTAATSPAGAVLMCASVAVSGTLLFACLPLSREWPASGEFRPRLGAIENPAFRALLGAILLTGFAWGVLTVELPALAIRVGSPRQAGVLLAVLSVGSMVGGLAFGARTSGASLAKRHRFWLFLVGASVLPLLAARSTPTALVFAMIAGCPWAPLLTCQYTLISATAPRAAITEAFTWNTAAFVSGISAGSLTAGPLIDHVGPNTSVLLVCAATALAVGLSPGAWPRRQPAET